MHIVIEKNEYPEVFGEDILDWIYKAVQDQIEIDKSNFKPSSTKIIGGMAYDDVIDAPDGLRNIWVDYDYKILTETIIQANISRLIVYDEIPDIVLDRINELNKMWDEILTSSEE